jgi:hypothetical protein
MSSDNQGIYWVKHPIRNFLLHNIVTYLGMFKTLSQQNRKGYKTQGCCFHLTLH